jgi:hypothetical protein
MEGMEKISPLGDRTLHEVQRPRGEPTEISRLIVQDQGLTSYI